MRFPSAALLLATSLLSLASPTFAAQKSCRDCDCEIYLTGDFGYDRAPSPDYELDNFIDVVAKKVTGSYNERGWYWDTRPGEMKDQAEPTRLGKIHFWRLCGNGAWTSHQWAFNHWGTLDTFVRLNCNCGRSVVCQRGSKCEDSEI